MTQRNSDTPIKLRSYQKKAIEALGDFIENHTTDDSIGIVCIPTGGGKNFTAAAYLAIYIENPKNKVIWFAPESELLVQAKQALVQFLGNDNLLRRIGSGSNQPELKKLSKDLDGQIFLSTLQAWHRSTNKHSFNRFKKNLLIIVDEVHWGINAAMFKALSQFCRMNNGRTVPILGLTATPRQSNHIDCSMVFSISYAELARQGYLAIPVVVCVSTGCEWDPIFDQRGLISNASLSALNSPQRNAVIVETVLGALALPGRKGILFAGNVNHAVTLYQTFLRLDMSNGFEKFPQFPRKDRRKVFS